MSKVKKILKITKKCIKEPAMVKKGLKSVYKYGFKETKARMNKNLAGNMQRAVSYDSEKDKQYTSDIKFSIVMPVYNVDIKYLDMAIKSIQEQNYINWELCIADDCSTKPEVREYLQRVTDKRIKITYLEKNRGISGASNAAAELATGEFILLMDNDDAITYDALYEFMIAIKEQGADLIYSDQNIIDQEGNGREPLHKPDWSPDLLLSQMYIGHLVGFRRSLFEEVGGFREEFNGSQDYDLILRIIEKTDNIVHVPKVLYGWRDIPTSTATNPQSKPYAQTSGLKALQEHMDRTLGEGKAVVNETEDLFVYDVRYKINENPLVSIIIPTKDHVDLLKELLDSIIEKTTYKNYEIIILNNNSVEQKSFEYFKEIQSVDNIRVIEASYDFNWSKLNNHGIREAKGDVYIIMNNDMKIITDDWMERLVEKAIIPENGIIGGLLLYEDDTIQHAGIVVGLGGYADHIYKGCNPVHYGSPFISPMVTRNVTACTGALQAFSKKTVEKIGLYDEDFIICGSDVEFCIRANQYGLKNVYDPHVKLYHYESKSRDSYIPEVDFKMSNYAYKPYNKEGDPYYNDNLDYGNTTPTIANDPAFSKKITSCDIYLTKENRSNVMNENEILIPEITPYIFRESNFKGKRINLLVPSINPEHVFGGIATALKFFDELVEKSGFASRIILTDAYPTRVALKKYADKYRLINNAKDVEVKHQIVPYNERYKESIPVSKDDIFVFTGWWTAHCTHEEYVRFEKKTGIKPNKFIYFIQDYEPGFYPWSTRYLLADSTYRSNYEHIAVFNSSLLYDFFEKNNINFSSKYMFEPVLNAGLKKVLLNNIDKDINKKKQIIVYGRPSVERNAFSLVVSILREWVGLMDDVNEWDILSAGEYHDSVDLGKGKKLTSVGKMSIEEYANMMLESYAGISLMSSPHPSYPPLEMATFGVNVITNSYANKDLSKFSKNIVSVDNLSPIYIAEKLKDICKGYNPIKRLEIENKSYVENENVFDFIDNIISEIR